MIFLLTIFSLFATPSSNPSARVRFSNGVELQVEVARTFAQRQQGLMNRNHLDENAGMLFIFNHPHKLSFWMKNTYIPLSIAYIDKNKVIKEIYAMEPQVMMHKDQNLTNYPSHCACLYALEVNQGWFRKNKIEVGDKISYSLSTQ